MTNDKLPFKLPSSVLSSHHIFGFKKKDIPYIIHLAKIDPSSVHQLWELKVASLKLGKKLNVFTHQKQADVDIHSVLLYKEILENILIDFSKHFKAQVRTLVISFPEQLSISLLDKFFIIFKLFMKKSFPRLKHSEVSQADDKLKWIYFSVDEPSSILNLQEPNESITPSKLMETFFTNPNLFKPVSNVTISPDSIKNFPELDFNENDEKVESLNGNKKYKNQTIKNDILDEIASFTLNQIQEKINLKFSDNINYFCNDQVLEKKLSFVELKTISFKEIEQNHNFFKFIFYHIEVDNTDNYIEDIIKKLINEFSNINFNSKKVKDKIASFKPAIQSFIFYCKDVFKYCNTNEISTKELLVLPLFHEKKSIFLDETDYLMISSQGLENTEDEVLFTKILNAFISKTKIDRFTFLNLKFNDKKEIDNTKKHLYQYALKVDTSDEFDSFKTWVINKLNSIIFTSNEEFFSIDKAKLKVTRTNEKKEVEKNKKLLKLYINYKDVKKQHLPETIPGNTKDEKEKFLKGLESFFSKEIIDSVPESELNEVKAYFADSFDATMPQTYSSIDTSSILNDGLKDNFKNQTLVNPLREYTRNSFYFNDILRKNDTDSKFKDTYENTIIDLIESLYHKDFTLPSDLIVVRGLNNDK